MGIKEIRYNFRVEVYPRSPGDLGFASVSGIQQTEREALTQCEAIADQIRRHVDDLPSAFNSRSRGVHIRYEIDRICEHCGSAWTEKSTTYNGGCCDEDVKNDPDADKPTAADAINDIRADLAKIMEGRGLICGCGNCSEEYQHKSDCAVHNAPAMPVGPCDCRTDGAR